MEKSLYCVEWSGNMTVVSASSAAGAERIASRRFGSYNGPYKASEATTDDVAWFKAMGGYVEEGTK